MELEEVSELDVLKVLLRQLKEKSDPEAEPRLMGMHRRWGESNRLRRSRMI